MSSKPVICVVEDDESVRRSLVVLLESSGFAVLPFSSAEEFLRSTGSKAAACIVVDIRLPGMTGIELLNGLADEGVTTPSIVMTGHADSETVVEAPKREPIRFLSKPWDPADLLNAISIALQQNNPDRPRPSPPQSSL